MIPRMRLGFWSGGSVASAGAAAGSCGVPDCWAEEGVCLGVGASGLSCAMDAEAVSPINRATTLQVILNCCMNPQGPENRRLLWTSGTTQQVFCQTILADLKR